MDIKVSRPKFFYLVASILLCWGSFGGANVIHVMDFGAVGDGRTDDSQAFLKAWAKACSSPRTQRLIVPSKKSFMLGPITFQGPCNSSRIHVKISGHILAPRDISGWKNSNISNWIIFDSVKSLTLTGSGRIDGQGSFWWQRRRKNKNLTAPTAVWIQSCDDFQMNKLHFVDSQRDHIFINGSTGVKVSKLTITAPENSINTDGIHVQNAENVQIWNLTIGTGDDCVSIGSNTSNVNVSQIFCGPGHGISIGSLGKYLGEFEHSTVKQIHVSNCTFTNTTNGVRIKTWQGGSGSCSEVSFKDIIINSSDNPIIIDQYYCNGDYGCTNSTSTVKISDISFVHVSGTSNQKHAIKFACSENVGCTGIHVADVHLTGIDSKEELESYCLNARGVSNDVQPPVDCLSHQM